MSLRLPPALPDEVITQMVDESMDFVRRMNLPYENPDWWMPSNEPRELFEVIDEGGDYGAGCRCGEPGYDECDVYGEGFELREPEEVQEELDTTRELVLV